MPLLSHIGPRTLEESCSFTQVSARELNPQVGVADAAACEQSTCVQSRVTKEVFSLTREKTLQERHRMDHLSGHF